MSWSALKTQVVTQPGQSSTADKTAPTPQPTSVPTNQFVYKAATERPTEFQTVINDNGAVVDYCSHFISKTEAHALLEQLTKELPFKQDLVRLNDKEVTTPRLGTSVWNPPPPVILLFLLLLWHKLQFV